MIALEGFGYKGGFLRAISYCRKYLNVQNLLDSLYFDAISAYDTSGDTYLSIPGA